MSEPKSGLQMLEEISEKLDLISKRFEIIEQNTKELLKRANDVQPQVQVMEKTIDSARASIKGMGIIPEPLESERPTVNGSATAKIIGKLKTPDGKSICGVQTKIFNPQGQVVKETKTNRAGEMICFLPPGSYKAHYFLENIIDAQVSFNIKPDEKLVRLAAPTQTE